MNKNKFFHYDDIRNIKYKLRPINNKYLKGYSYEKLMMDNINTSLLTIINIADKNSIKLFKHN